MALEMSLTGERRKIFISYSHKDAKWLQRIRGHLKSIEREHPIEVWVDTRISPSSSWREEIQKSLSSTKVAVLLVSEEFLKSDFITTSGLSPLLSAAEKDGLLILGLILNSPASLTTDVPRFYAINPVNPLADMSQHEQEAMLLQLTDTIKSLLGCSPDDKTEQTQQDDLEDVMTQALIEGRNVGAWGGLFLRVESEIFENVDYSDFWINQDKDTRIQFRNSDSNRRQTVSLTLPTGSLLNTRYEIVRKIGGGGMGAVYLAKDTSLGDAPRAVKEMIESHLDGVQHERAVNNFRRESLLLTTLEHPSIPTIYDYFYDEGNRRFYLVMNYISGGDFASRLRNSSAGCIEEKTVTQWAVQIADVLDYLHNHRPPIVYRDLKPANLMINDNAGRVMLIDFGIARLFKQGEKGVTAVGTMGYAPPELFSGKVEPRSDIYSLGATMFHLLTGANPQDNPLLIFDFTRNRLPRQINPAMSAEMERILMRAVEYKPENRFRSAAEMREVLNNHLDTLGGGEVSYSATLAQQLGGDVIKVQMVLCNFCDGRIAEDDVYCAHCGQRQTLASARPIKSGVTAKLTVAGTTELDASFTLKRENNLVGRNDPHSSIFPEVDLSRFDPEAKVSRRHLRIWRQGENFLIEDLNSVNGTVVNTFRLAPNQPRLLESGDKLRLGEVVTLMFSIE